MSRMSDMLNGKKKFVTVKSTPNTEEEFDKALGRLRTLIEDGLIDLANGLADELEKNEEKTAEEAVEDAVKNTCEEFEKNAKKAGWSCTPSKEMIDHPSHYQGKKFEVIDIIEDYGLGFNLGNAIKYILRAGHKDSYIQDLNKAIWYLNREINGKNISKGL